MSQSEVERFADALESDSALQAEMGGESAGTLAVVVDLAKRRGYDFTLDDLKAFAQARAGAAARELSTADLDAMAGGGNRTPVMQRYLEKVLGEKGQGAPPRARPTSRRLPMTPACRSRLRA